MNLSNCAWTWTDGRSRQFKRVGRRFFWYQLWRLEEEKDSFKSHLTFSISVARMTRGPRTAYCIFLMQGFMLSWEIFGENENKERKIAITSWSVAVGAMVVEEDTRVLAKVAREVLVWRPGLKLIIMMASELLLLLLPLLCNWSARAGKRHLGLKDLEGLFRRTFGDPWGSLWKKISIYRCWLKQKG